MMVPKAYNNVGKEAGIEIEHEQFGVEQWTAAVMSELAGDVFAIETRVPGASGLAFDWQKWFEEWLFLLSYTTQCKLSPPTHLKLYAADSFEAIIPWEQLRDAAVLFAEEDGSPLTQAGPIRFYVPNGTSKCLNVKNVVRVVISTEELPSDEAAYGFKQQWSADELKMKK
ncbi:hypothetical protein DFQ01_11048 [Paenibacillus cellulosilyticus]|uniref:Molybdopterin-dependent oxidoreductase-like protein n=1 Tax=Paenibacillus cellulosilyticus TaxID=375489 RepID=A0A2V2YSH5_9BACL|nr:hypothetical protein [Paenibacillus cellulosilyticus]PWW01158.1 hypothetical protein DFQ01_11048 [Paenibacillus cellulosilyticus]QKS46880.1 hypothetical protein HUB94_20575 [Paenibacillus cellulosilyticus]